MKDDKKELGIDNINPDTGEVKDKALNSFVSPFQDFRFDKTEYVVDLSDPYAEIFEEVPPFTIDPETGKFLNDTSQPKIVSKGKINVQERIDSFGREVDLYSILERFAYGEDTSLLNARQCSYGDISNLPDNLNDYAAYVDAHYKKLAELNPELAKKVLDENISAESIQKDAQSMLDERISNFNKENEKKVEDK